MNIIQLHSEWWEQANARRAQWPHAVLISGQRGLGKALLARELAASFLCEAPTETQQACGHCLACGWLAQGNHPDFRLLQPEAMADERSDAGESSAKKKPSQQITIDQVRGLDEFLHVGTHRQGVRVVLIHPAEAMNRATANSLLKSLEEPIAGTVFLLVTNEAERLLPTIRSRCQQMAVPLPPPERAEAWLREAGVAEAAEWLALAGGSPLFAMELAGDEERALLDAVLGALKSGPAQDPLAAAAALDRAVKAEKRPQALRRVIDWAQKWVFDLTLASEGLPLRYFAMHGKTLVALARTSQPADLLAFGRKTLQYRMQSEQPVNSRLFLEEFLLAYASLFRAERGRHV